MFSANTAILRKVVGKVHATILKGIVGGFQFNDLQRNFKEWPERPWTKRLLKETNSGRFDSYSVRNSVLNICHITFRDCHVHIFSRNSPIPPFRYLPNQ